MRVVIGFMLATRGRDPGLPVPPIEDKKVYLVDSSGRLLVDQDGNYLVLSEE